MARKPTAAKKRGAGADDDGPEDDREIGRDHNEKKFEGDVLAKYLETVAAAEQRMADRMQAASKKNQADRKLIKEATKELTESGYEAKVLATVRRKAKLELKIETIDSTLDDSQKETFASMIEALGEFADTPLGRAATDRAGR